MSSLTDNDKRYFEDLLSMRGGYVLDFNNATFGELFNGHKIDIHSVKYQTYGTSKAKKMRAFWEKESDAEVAAVLSEMLDSYTTSCELSGDDINTVVLEKCRSIIIRLASKSSAEMNKDIEDFLEKEISMPNIHKLPIEPQVALIIENRLKEALAVFQVKAYLSVIFLCGSVLEGVLIGMTQRYPEKFNRSNLSPRNQQGKVEPFYKWSLADLIDVACDVRFLQLDVKKFSHGLREFRNYIHPYQQMSSGFTPDEHTAKVCLQVLKAAPASLAGERS